MASNLIKLVVVVCYLFPVIRMVQGGVTTAPSFSSSIGEHSAPTSPPQLAEMDNLFEEDDASEVHKFSPKSVSEGVKSGHIKFDSGPVMPTKPGLLERIVFSDNLWIGVSCVVGYFIVHGILSHAKAD